MSDSEEDVEQNFGDYHEPSYVLIAIDTHPSMFVQMNEDNELTYFEVCLRACYEIANSLLLLTNRRNWCPFGIIVPNPDGVDDDNERKSTIIDFKTNMIDVVKHLKMVSQLKLDDLIENFQRKDLQSFDLSHFFLLCKKKLMNIQSQHYDKLLIYLTNDDDPVGNNSNRRFTILNEARNFEPNNIKFEMITMKNDFDYFIFYNELFSVTDENEVFFEQYVEDEEGLIEKLTRAITLRYYQRPLPLYFDKNDKKRFLRIMQKNYISSGKLMNNHYTTTTGRPVKKLTVSETDDIDYSLIYGNKKIDFNQSEYDEIKNTNLPIGYTLIYVAHRVTQTGFVLNDPVIIEKDPKENLPYFLDFWVYCADKGCALICARKLRKNDKIRYFELTSKCINNKPTFLAKHIPFASEIEYPAGYPFVTDDAIPVTSRTQFQAISDIFRLLKLDYHPGMFPSISYMKKENYVKSKLLNEEEEEVDDVEIDKPAIDERVARHVNVFLSEFELNKQRAPKRTPSSENNTGLTYEKPPKIYNLKLK